ncbi:hypothetical protein M446_4596 [Methylobacterium sp. 4-46]|uniref:hypothetical protein n=1 Tax=unclassified Methylobacterium TaxID=2615210 RepID=UPI000152DBD4|nr:MULTISPECIES: hypothetical protein [Methylobacterium]ACA18936.1 hypothetical protein M446_4596 [Methylobacterium sp. 4-46]WFT78159.1 hypothetical protein QA634_23070 [Methylobacterium nodulans]
MHIQVAPVLSAFGFVLGCAILRMLRGHARAVTPILVTVALALLAAVMLMLEWRGLPAAVALTQDQEVSLSDAL